MIDKCTPQFLYLQSFLDKYLYFIDERMIQYLLQLLVLM